MVPRGIVTPSGATTEIQAPAVLGLEEVLQGAPTTVTIRATEPGACFRIGASALLTMVSNNALLAQRLFEMLLAPADLERAQHPPLSTPVGAGTLLRPVDRALMLREHPLLARATPAQLLALIEAAVEVPTTAGTVLVDRDNAPAFYQVLDGELCLETTAGAIAVSPGMTVGLAETLAGEGAAVRAVVTRPGRALRVERDDLFAVLTDHVDLMQGVFSETLILPRKNLLGMAAEA